MTRTSIAIALAAALLLPISASAQQSAPPDRSNRGGEVRGKERADQVRGANTEKRDTRGAGKEKAQSGKERGGAKK